MRKTNLFILLLIFLCISSSGAYVLNCPGVTYYNTYQTITYSDCVNSSYWEVGPDYFILSDMNFTIASLASNFCDYNLSFFNDTFSNQSVIPYRFFEFNATYSLVGVDSFVLDMPSSYLKIDLQVNNLLVVDDVEEAGGVYSFSHSFPGVSQVYSFWIDSYIPECPSGGNSTYDPISNTVNFTWSNTSRADSFVLVRNYNSYPSSVSDGVIVQNSSVLFYNTSLSNESFFSLWAYNLSSNTFSLDSCKLDLEWGAVIIHQVYNESSPSMVVSPFGILISNELGTDVYWDITATAPLKISKNDIPFGSNTIISINATGYKTTRYYFDYEVNNLYNHTFYIAPMYTVTDPGTGDSGDNDSHITTRLYRLRVVDEYAYPIADAMVNIKRHINTTNTFENTTIVNTNGYGEADVYLVPNINYKAFVVKESYTQVGSKDWFPDPVFYGILYPMIFQMQSNEPVVDQYKFWDVIGFNGTMYDNDTMYVVFDDALGNTTNALFYTYETFNWSRILVATNSSTASSFSFWLTGINTSREHEIELHLNHTNLGDIVISIFIQPLRQSNQTTEDTLRSKIVAVAGEVTGINILHLIFVYIPSIALLGWFGKKKFPEIGTFACAFWIAFIGTKLSIPIEAYALAPFIVALGFLLVLIKGGVIKL